MVREEAGGESTMGNLAIKEPPEFQQEIHQVEEEEYLTAELENGIKGALLNNDVYLKQKLEEILENIENGGGGTTFPLEVPNSKEIKFIGVEDADNGNKLVSHILYKNKNDLVLKAIDEENNEKNLINITEDAYGKKVEMNAILHTKQIESKAIALKDNNGGEITLVAIETDNGSGFLLSKDGSVYEDLLKIDGDGYITFSHCVSILEGDLNLDAENSQNLNFINFSIGQNGSYNSLVLKNGNKLLAEYDSNLESFINYKKNVIKNDIQIVGRDPGYENYGYQIFQDLDSLVLQGNNGDLLDTSDWYTIMRLCYESSEMYLSGINSIFLPNMSSLYFGNSSIEGTYFTIEEKRLEAMYMHTFSLMAVRYNSISKHEIRGILFNFVNNQPIWQVIQEQHSAQSAWFLDFNFYDSNHTNKKRIAYLGESEVHFEVPVTASNITKTANELKLAQQEITEQDLQLIETHQMLTDQELENIETQQLLTEMDLERLEGGQAV